MSRIAGRALVAEAARPGAAALVALTGVGLLVVLGQSLQQAAVAPGPAGTLRLLVALLPGVVAFALPVSLLFGVVAAARAWREGGDWLALATAGHGARALAPSLVLAGLLAGLLQAGLTHLVEPLGRREARRTLVDAAGQLHLQPGRPALVGPALLHAADVVDDELIDVLIAQEGTVVGARRGRLLGGGRVALDEGSALGLDDAASEAWRLSFQRAELALDLAAPRIELVERSDAELLEAIRRKDAAGSPDVHARHVLHKRSSLPAALPLLVLLAVPLGARGGRPALVAALTALGWWTVLRVSDQALETLGPLVSAWSPPLVLAVAVVAAWARWEAR